MKFSKTVILSLFVSIVIMVLFILAYFSSISIGEKLPKLEELINSTISYNISANLEMEIKGNLESTSYYSSFSIKNCSFLYLTNNVSVLKCNKYYIKKERDDVISCEKTIDGWDCYNWVTLEYYIDIAELKEFLSTLLENINYTIIKKAINKINGRYSYCYNISISKLDKYTSSIRLNITTCFDKQTKIPIFVELIAIGIIEGIGQRLYVKYNLSNLVVNPKYEDYKEMLIPPTPTQHNRDWRDYIRTQLKLK